MISREKGAGFEAINGLKLGFLKADDGRGSLRNGEPDIVAFAPITEPSYIPGENGESHKESQTPPNPEKCNKTGLGRKQASNMT
jgi:hypothetical protein